MSPKKVRQLEHWRYRPVLRQVARRQQVQNPQRVLHVQPSHQLRKLEHLGTLLGGERHTQKRRETETQPRASVRVRGTCVCERDTRDDKQQRTRTSKKARKAHRKLASALTHSFPYPGRYFPSSSTTTLPLSRQRTSAQPPLSLARSLARSAPLWLPRLLNNASSSLAVVYRALRWRSPCITSFTSHQRCTSKHLLSVRCSRSLARSLALARLLTSTCRR